MIQRSPTIVMRLQTLMPILASLYGDDGEFGSGTCNDPRPWEGELRNMWKPTQQAGLWFHSHGVGGARFYSRLLALQIKAREAGIATPVYKVAEVQHGE